MRPKTTINSLVANMSAKEVERFWSHVSRSDGNACWPWKLSRMSAGYGQVSVRGVDRRHIVTTHRVAYVLTHGPLPEGLIVLHSCDNRICCNPAHLSAGTFADNIHDMLGKGRDNFAHGTNHPQAVLNDEIVRYCRSVYSPGDLEYGARALARRFGVTTNVISRIVKRTGWVHVSDDSLSEEAA